MEKFFTLLVGLCVAVSSFSQEGVTVAYMVENPTGYSSPDSAMLEILDTCGFDVTVLDVAGEVITSGYEVVFFSETIGSGNYPDDYATAPLPFILESFAAKPSKFGWIGEGMGTYGNVENGDSVFVKVSDHDIATDLPDKFKVFEGMDEDGGLCQFVNFMDNQPSDAVNVFKMEHPQSEDSPDTEFSLVALNQDCEMNGVTIANRAVMLGIHGVAYNNLTKEGATVVKNSLLWAAGIEIDPGNGNGGGGPINSIDKLESEIQASIYLNPLNNIVKLSFNKYVGSAIVSVLALDGRTLITEPVNQVKSKSIDVSHLNHGIYVINISGNNINYTKKISIQ